MYLYNHIKAHTPITFDELVEAFKNELDDFVIRWNLDSLVADGSVKAGFGKYWAK